MLGCKQLVSVSYQLRDVFAGRENDAIKLVILLYHKAFDELRVLYYSDIKMVMPFSDQVIVLACYYAPKGDWRKWYGDDWCWDLTPKRMALDIINNTLLYNNDFTMDGRDLLPSWLRSDINSWL